MCGAEHDLFVIESTPRQPLVISSPIFFSISF